MQALITQNIDNLRPGTLIYGCLLTPQGKFLHDLFIHEQDECLMIDCEGGARAIDLAKRLNMYKLRAKVTIEVIEKNEVFSIAGDRKHGMPDPRHPEMGNRSMKRPENLPERAFYLWDEHRIKLCIPDGSRDLIPEKSTMDEGWIDLLNGVDYKKGCYIGQELTARMHYRGLGKKHLYGIEGHALPPSGNILTLNGGAAAEMRSRSGAFGMGLIKDQFRQAFETAGYKLSAPK